MFIILTENSKKPFYLSIFALVINNHIINNLNAKREFVSDGCHRGKRGLDFFKRKAYNTLLV
jgi:hypothetical protein